LPKRVPKLALFLLTLSNEAKKAIFPFVDKQTGISVAGLEILHRPFMWHVASEPAREPNATPIRAFHVWENVPGVQLRNVNVSCDSSLKQRGSLEDLTPD
jgi:hypothetical protein